MNGRRTFAGLVCCGLALMLLTWPVADSRAPAAHAQETASDILELLPAKTEFVVQVRGLDGFQQRLDKLLRETMPAAADAVRKTLQEQIEAFLEGRDRKQLDGQRAIFLAVEKWQSFADHPPAVVIGLPIRDGEAFLKGFLSGEEYKQLQLRPEGYRRTVIAGQEVFIYLASDYALLTPKAELAGQLAALARNKGQAKPLSLRSQLRAEETRLWSQADVAAYLKIPPLFALVEDFLKNARKQLPELLRGQAFGHSQQAIAEMVLDFVELGRDLDYCLITGSIENEGVRLRLAARTRANSPLAQSLANARRHSVADLDRMPENLHQYGSWDEDWMLEPFLRRYARAIRQAGNELSPASAAAERLLADTAEKLLQCGIRRWQWAQDSQYRGLWVFQAEKPEQAKRVLVQACEQLAGLLPKDAVRMRVQAEAGQLLGLPTSRIDAEIRWSHFSTAHGESAAAEEAFLRHMFGHQWTIWLAADNQQLYILLTGEQKEAEQWLQRYRSSNAPPFARLQKHRAPLGDELTGLMMLQFPGWWRHVLEGVEKASAAMGLGNLIPKDAYPGNTPAFFSLGFKLERDTIILELWAPKETLSELNSLWIFAVHGLF